MIFFANCPFPFLFPFLSIFSIFSFIYLFSAFWASHSLPGSVSSRRKCARDFTGEGDRCEMEGGRKAAKVLTDTQMTLKRRELQGSSQPLTPLHLGALRIMVRRAL